MVRAPDWTEVVAAAVRAPSIHNTQPWLFLGRPDRLELLLDPERALSVLDRTRRQQVISCGCALEFALVALRAAGQTAEVDLLPEPTDGDHLATIQVTGDGKVTEEDGERRAAIDRRHTVRSAFERRSIPTEVIDRFAAVVEEYGVWVKPITGEEEQVATAVLLGRAEEMERDDPDYLDELQRWVRSDPSAPDGVPVDALPGQDPATRPSNWLIRDFVAGQHAAHTFMPQQDPDAPPPPVERPAVLLLGTQNDDRRAWLTAGRALGRLLLDCTSAGIAASPLTQALDWPATRTQLRLRLSLLGHPQMLLRLGYTSGSDTPVVSGRRPLADVLRTGPA